MIISTIIFCAYVILTLAIFWVTDDLKNRGNSFAPYILVRVLLIPIGMAGLGWISQKIVEFVFGRKMQTNQCQKAGKIISISIALFNIIFSLPYVLWIAFLCLKMPFEGSIQAQFPGIPIFQEISRFFLNLMYNYPFVYIFIGIAFAVFFPKRNCIRDTKGDDHKVNEY